MKIILNELPQTRQLAQQLVKASTQPVRLFLKGDLGAGKTTFARQFIEALGYHGLVKSPTYTLVETYPLEPIPVYHFDWYRLEHPQELENIGIWDYLNDQAHCLIEWPEKGQDVFNAPDLSLDFFFDGQERYVITAAYTALGEALESMLEDLT